MDISINTTISKRKLVSIIIVFLTFLFLITVFVFMYFMFNKWNIEKKKKTRREKLNELHKLLQNEKILEQEIQNFQDNVSSISSSTSNPLIEEPKEKKEYHNNTIPKKEKIPIVSYPSIIPSVLEESNNLEIDERDKTIIQEKLNLEELLSQQQMDKLHKLKVNSIPNLISQIHNVMIVIDEKNEKIPIEKERISNPLNIPSKIEEID
jgi:cell division protein FtsB